MNVYHVKKFGGSLCLMLIVWLSAAQNIYKEYVDGQVYLKVNQRVLKGLSKENPNNLPLQKIGILKHLASDVGLSRISIPFYQANDDPFLMSVLKLEFQKKEKIDEFIAALSRLSDVEYAEKVRLDLTHAVPNDPLFATASGSTHLNQINAQNAWNVFNGTSTVAVAIVDNAVMSTHTDLAANIYVNTAEANGSTGVDDDGNGFIDDVSGYDVADMDPNPVPTNINQDHGSHCAGIAGAVTNNSVGVAGIGWNIRIVPVKASYNTSSTTIVNEGYRGIIYAVKAKAKIISCSWGNSGSPSITEQAVIDYAWNRGCLIFASAGNLSSTTPNYPGAYSNVYCVAAVNSSNVKSSYSNYGTWVDISAPGDGIVSTTPYTTSPAYLTYSGTSMATPLVAGLAALMRSKSPNMTRTDILNCLSSTAANIYSLSGNASYVSGSQLGAGRIDAFAAMNCAATYSALPPVANFYAFLPNTCPFTPIPFSDSSLYAPTSWNWTFQGGSPATSTLANPVVQWTTTGTYSVSLTVSNANGNSTKTKLSYVNVVGPSSLPFAEGFQSGNFLPAGWVANNLWNDPIYWQLNTSVGGFGNSTACAMFNNYDYNAPGERDEMRTPKFDFTQVASARLRFDVAYARYDATFSDSLEVRLSSDCGSTWNSIYLKGGSTLATSADQSNKFIPASNKWRRDTIDISLLAAGQSNVMFGFLNRGGYGQPIYLDNINLVFPSPTLAITNAASVCVGSSVSFSNSSISAATYSWNFQGANLASSTATNPTVSYATPGTYTLQLIGLNGTSLASITKTITVLAPPSLTLSSSASGSVCAGSSVTLSATGASSYSWSTGTLSNAIVVTPAASAVYTVTGIDALCSSEGTVGVTVGSGPLVVSITSATNAICYGQTLALNASGANSYTWSNSSSTASSISVNPLTTTQYTLSGSTGNCVGNAFLTITVTALPSTSITTTNSSGCADQCNGSIQASSSGGSAPFTYSLNQSLCPSFPCTNLCEGLYTLYTINSEGCSSSSIFSIGGPAPIQAAVSATNASCGTCADGIAAVNPSGGTAPYTYTWQPSGGNNATASGLLPGCYTVSITDNQACNSSTTVCLSISTALMEQDMEALHIFPNPAQDEIHIEWQGQTFDVLLSNHLGQVILEEKNIVHQMQMQTQHLARGLYYLRLSSGDAQYHHKQILK